MTPETNAWIWTYAVIMREEGKVICKPGEEFFASVFSGLGWSAPGRGLDMKRWDRGCLLALVRPASLHLKGFHDEAFAFISCIPPLFRFWLLCGLLFTAQTPHLHSHARHHRQNRSLCYRPATSNSLRCRVGSKLSCRCGHPARKSHGKHHRAQRAARSSVRS